MSIEGISSPMDWIANAPSNWAVAPLGSHFDERNEIVSDADYPPLSVTMSGVVPQMEHVAKTDNGASRKLVRAGDLAINSRSDRKGSSGISSLEGSVSVIYTILSPRASLHGRFAHHLLRSTAFQEEFYRWGSGIVADLWSTRYTAMKRIPLATPSLDEQRAIADYLDQETAQIDALVAKQEEFIGLLRERRSVAIDSTIGTPGDRGPAVRLKYLLQRIDQGVSPQADSSSATSSEWGVLKAGCVNRGVFREVENKRLPPNFAVDPSIVVQNGDLIVSRANGTPAYVGSAAVVRNLERNLILSDKLFRLVPAHDVNPDFLAWSMNARHYRNQVEASISGAAGLANNLPLSDLRSFYFARPAFEEQERIVKELEVSTSRIDTLIARAEEHIALAKERRSALITAAVTGQIDVRTARKAS